MADRSKNRSNVIGDRIKYYRLDWGFTQKQLALYLNKSESAVRMWELGSSEPDIETLRLIAHRFNISIDKLIAPDEKLVDIYQDPDPRTITKLDSLIELRKKNKLTQSHVADHLGISRQGYAKYEQGIREPSIDIIKKLCDYYSVSADFLIGTKFSTPFPTMSELEATLLELFRQVSAENREMVIEMIRAAIGNQVPPKSQ